MKKKLFLSPSPELLHNLPSNSHGSSVVVPESLLEAMEFHSAFYGFLNDLKVERRRLSEQVFPKFWRRTVAVEELEVGNHAKGARSEFAACKITTAPTRSPKAAWKCRESKVS